MKSLSRFFRWRARKNQAVIPAQSPELRVVLVCYLKPGNPGGYEIRVIEEARILRKLGVYVVMAVYIAPDKFADKQHTESYRNGLEEDTGAVIRIFPTTCFFDLHESDLLRQEIDAPLENLLAEQQVSILHAEALYAAFHALRVGKKSRTRVIFDIHGALAEETIMRGGNPGWIQKLNEVERILLTQVDACIMVSHSMGRFLRDKHRLAPSRVEIVPCCVHSDEFGMTNIYRENQRKQKGFDGKFVLLYLGTLSVWQWPEAMFNLFFSLHKVFPESFLYLLIPAYDQEKAREYLRNAHIPDSAFVMEEVSHSQAGRYIGLADAGLLLREAHDVNTVSSPTKFGEYLASGLPVILTRGIGDYSGMAGELNIGLLMDVVNDQLPETGLKTLHAFCQEVAADRAGWSARCRRAAVDHLDWSQAGKSLSGLYQQLTHHSHESPE